MIKIFVSMLILSSIEDQNDNAIAKEKLFETRINSQLGLLKILKYLDHIEIGRGT